MKKMNRFRFLYRIFVCMAVVLATFQLVDDSSSDVDYISLPEEVELCAADNGCLCSSDSCLQASSAVTSGTARRVLPRACSMPVPSGTSSSSVCRISGTVRCPQPHFMFERRAVFCVYRI